MWPNSRHRAAAVLLLLYLATAVRALDPNTESPFDGWAGETYMPTTPLIKQAQSNGSQQRATAAKPWIQVVSYKPRSFLYHNFLTPEEALHIRRIAMPQMRRSTVVGANGSSVLDEYRTSFGSFVKRQSDPVVSAITNRIAEWTKLPEIHQEDMQVLRYGQGQQYRVHMDTLHTEEGGPRVATVLMYLADTEEGGETIFPMSGGWANPAAAASLADASPCARGKVGAKAKMGDALLFWSINPDGSSEDLASNHAACPVVKGSKWSAPVWIHAKPYNLGSFTRKERMAHDPGLCADDDITCKDWAAAGECVKNKGFMVGSPAAPGRCMRSCNACTPCKAGDKSCYNSNRARLGYLVYDPSELGWPSIPGLNMPQP